MNLPIYLLGHPVLRAKANTVTPEYPDLAKLIEDMYQTMYGSDGVGLAAPQIGRSDRIVVIDASPVGDAFPECEGRRLTLINPEVTVLDGEKVSRPEGCLSIPGVSEDIKRVEHISLKWLDENFEPHQEEMSGFLARIVQHECEHLDGTVFTDHCSPIRKQLIKSKLNNIANGKTRPDYPYRTAPRRR